MSDMTVKDFAVKVGRDVPRLLEQMKEAGLAHASENDAVSEEDKQTLLSFLKKSHGGSDADAGKNRITLTRKTRSRIKTGERGKTIEVQVRKKKTYVKREEEEKPKAAEPEHTGPRQLVGDMAEAEAERKVREAEERAAAEKAKAAEDAARKETEGKAAAAKLEVPELQIDDTPASDDLPPAPPKEGRTDRRTAPPKKTAAKKKGRDDDEDRGDREERKRGGAGKKAKRAERRGGRRGSVSGNGKH
ncbi:translation initiation factor IF-2 associated domain-containing protein, partial [Halomonas sp. 707D4]